MVSEEKASEILRRFQRLDEQGMKVWIDYKAKDYWRVIVEPDEKVLSEFGDYKHWNKPVGFEFEYDGEELTFREMVKDPHHPYGWETEATWSEGDIVDPERSAERLLDLMERREERNPIGKVKTYEGRGTVHLTVAPKERFKKFRTQDIGRPGHTMRVAGIDKRTGKWATQKYIFRKDDVVVVGGKIYPKNPRTARTLKQIADRHPRVRRKLASELLSGY